MPASSSAPSNKRQKNSGSRPTGVTAASGGFVFFKTGEDVRNALSNSESSLDALKISLQSLRNQLTVQENELPIAPNDQRLLLVQDWLEKSAGAIELFEIWETASKSIAISNLCISTLASLLSLLSHHYIYHIHADPIIKRLLDENASMRHLNNNLGSAQHEVVLVTLKLFNSLVNFAGGREKRSVMDGFAWGMKSLPKLFNMRRRGEKANEIKDPLIKPDIRTLFILFLLSFISTTTPTPLKSSLLEDHKDLFIGIFKGIHDDPYEIVQYVLEISWDGVWCDGKIARTTKLRVFGEGTLAQLTKLYSRSTPEDDEGTHIPADLVHHFLLAITTRPGTGLCFHDRGWYPRSDDSEVTLIEEFADDDAKMKSSPGGVFNKILKNLLKTLKVNEDPRQQELALKILQACPELVQGYWHGASMSLEPRLSSRWITNVAFLGSVISLPVPIRSFATWDPKIPSSSTSNTPSCYFSSPPPLSGILENIMPSIFSKEYISKGLLSYKEPLVVHCTALALTKILTKFQVVRNTFMEVEGVLEENVETGQWWRRRQEFEKHVRQRIPDFQVIIALSQKYSWQSQSGPASEESATGSQSKAQQTVLSEAALRLIQLYHRLLPEVVGDTRFDSGKLLSQVWSPVSEAPDATGLDILSQLHVLNILKESEQFSWTAKQGSSRSQMHRIMTLQVKNQNPHIRQAASSLAFTLLSRSVIFDHDPAEADVWLQSLPRSSRASGSKAPDGTPLLDESESVISFLDECISRCLKTPHHYLEVILDICYGASPPNVFEHSLAEQHYRSPHLAPSPLLATVLEQFVFKQNKQLMNSSDSLALITYLRSIFVGLIGKQPDLRSSSRLIEKLCAVVEGCEVTSLTISTAIARELRLIRNLMSHLGGSTVDDAAQPRRKGAGDGVSDFLKGMEATALGELSSGSVAELTDWIRFIDAPLLNEDVDRLSVIQQRWREHTKAAGDFLIHLDPSSVGNSVSPKLLRRCETLSISNLGWSFMVISIEALENDAIRHDLVDVVYIHSKSTASALIVVRLACLLFRPPISPTTSATEGFLLFMADLVLKFKTNPKIDLLPIKQVLIKESDYIKSTLCSDLVRSNVYEYFIQAILSPLSNHDKTLASEFVAFCISRIPLSLMDNKPMVQITPWIPFFEDHNLVESMERVLPAHHDSRKQLLLSTSATFLLERLSHAAVGRTSDSLQKVILSRIRELQSIAENIQSSSLADMLQSLVESLTPAGVNLLLPRASRFNTLTSLAQITALSSTCWVAHRKFLPAEFKGNDREEFPKTTLQASIASAFIHRSAHHAVSFMKKLVQKDINPPIPVIAPIIQSSLDNMNVRATIVDRDVYIIVPGLLTFITSKSKNQRDRNQAAQALLAIYQNGSDAQLNLAPLIADHISTLPCHHFFRLELQSWLLNLASCTRELNVKESLLDTCIDLGLHHAVRQFANEISDSDQFLHGLEGFVLLVNMRSDIKPHLSEPVFTAGINRRLSSPVVCLFLSSLAKRVKLKPINSNKLIQTLLQHPLFYHLCNSRTISSSPQSRDAIIKLLQSLFMINPTNACQPSHITPLAKIYGGTNRQSDRLLLSLFRSFEENRSLSSLPLFRHWNAAGTGSSTSALDALTSLEPSIVMRTCTGFPLPDSQQITIQAGRDIPVQYDPIFLLSLLSAALMDTKEMTHLDWVSLFRTNVVSVALRALACRELEIREIAAQALFILGHSLKDVEFQERDEVLLILTMARDAISPPNINDDEGCSTPLFSTLHSLLLAHALRCIFYPSIVMYPLIMRFLLQRPEVDTSDVPMLFASLYSTSDEWRQERWWIIQLIANGMSHSQDWNILTRRHVWDLLATMFQTSPSDKSLRKGILEVLCRLTDHRRAAMALILRASLLSWIGIQLREVQGHEVDAWLLILTNLVINADHHKCDTATLGAWRGSIATCLIIIGQVPGNTLTRTHGVISLYRRLFNGTGTVILNLELMCNLLRIITSLEDSITVAEDVVSQQVLTFQVRNPSARENDHVPGDAPMLWIWGHCVEMLWEIVMKGMNDTAGELSLWNALTNRLLLWNALCGGGSQVGEWARLETIRRLQTDIQ